MRHNTTVAAVLVACAVGAAALLAAPAVSALSPAQVAIRGLNAQREAIGLPPVSHRPEWSKRCAAHVRYMRLNDVLGHAESPSRRGYSEDGDWAARHSVLAHPDFAWWWNGVNPWEQAPIHLMQLLAWDLEYTGAAPGCMVTLGDPRREWDGATLELYSYPPDGQTGWRLKERADESPFTPGDLVGLPRGTVTGPHIYIIASSFFTVGGRIAEAWMTDERGRGVQIRHVDSTTRRGNLAIGPYMPPGGILIPVRPLRPRTTYTVHVEFELDWDPPLRAERTFRFTTGKPHPDTLVLSGRNGVTVRSKSRARTYVEIQRVPARKRVWSGRVRPGKFHPFRRPLRSRGNHLICWVQPETARHRESSGCVANRW